MRDIVFIGANNPEIKEMLEALGPSGAYRFLGFLDNDAAKKNTQYCGLPVFGGFDALNDFSRDDVSCVNLITRDTETRFETSQDVARMGFGFANLIHPSVNVGGVALGMGNYIQRDVVLQHGVTIGNNTCINSGTVVAHECTIGSSSFLAPGVSVAGLVDIGDGVMLGVGATVLPRLKLHDWALIGGGAVVTACCEAGGVYAGVPAKLLRTKPLREGGADPATWS